MKDWHIKNSPRGEFKGERKDPEAGRASMSWNSKGAGVVAGDAQARGESQTAEARPQRASQAH